MLRRANLCTNARENFAAAILVLFLAVFLAAAGLTPAAHAQTARDWSEAVCRAFGNCSSLRPLLVYQRASNYERQHLAAVILARRRGVSFVAQRSTWGFAFTGNNRFSTPGYRSSSLPSLLPAITSDTWKGGAGNWSTASMWTTGVPTSSNDVFICGGCGTTSPVTLDVSGTINNLTLDSKSSLSFNTSTSLTVNGGTISNAGSITLNGGNGTDTFLFLGAPTSLSGAGTLTLSSIAKNGGGAFIDGNGFTLTNTSTIQGEGVIGNGSLALVNSTGGIVNANSAGGTLSPTLTLNGSGGITNTGLLEATSSGVLAIGNVVNNSGGNITANGSTAIVELTNGADVQGGTLNTLSGGTLETATSNTAVTLDGTTHGVLTVSKNSTYTGALNSQTQVLGTINNNGSFVLNGGAGVNTEMTLTGNTTLQGTGSGVVTMNTTSSPGGNTFIQGNGFTLTNMNNTIQGEGIIGNGSLALVNQAGGTINANSTGTGVSGGPTTALTLNGSGGVTNLGLMEATNNGVLQIQNVVNNSGGNITANGSTAVVNLLNGANIQGGTLNTLNSGTMQTVSGNTNVTLDGSSHGALTLSTGSSFLSALNTQTLVLGTINNNGNITMQGGFGTNTEMTLNSATTLQGSGGGTVTLNTFVSPTGGNAYLQGNGFTLTNSNNTIQGEGIIGNGSLALVNQAGGTINANSTGTGVTGGPTTTLTLNGSGGVTNAGLLEATNNGILQLQSITVNNASGTGGNITANGGSVFIENATIQGGTLTNNSGTLETPTGWFSSVLDGRSTSQGGQGTLNLKGTYTSDYNSQTTMLGTINNQGNIQLNGGIGTNTTALMGISGAPNVTLQGGGTLTMNTVSSPTGGSAFITAASTNFTLTNVDNTIQGSGVIGNGSLGLINQGTINANSTGANSQTLTLALNGSGGVTNTGLMEATNNGILNIQNVVNNSGGNITANGSAAQVQLTNGANLQGGTLNTLNSGTIVDVTGNTNVTLDGSSHGALVLSTGTNYVSQLNTQTVALGTINNSGNIQLQGGDGTNTEMTLTTNTTLGGTGGKVTMTTFSSPAGGSAFIQGNGVSLTNTSNTIQGAGTIGNGSLTLVNSTGGTLLANSTGQTLLINGTGSITNSGTMQVTTGSTMHVQNGTFTNFASSTLTGGTYNTAGTLEIDELGTTGGEIVNNAATIILNGTGSSFVDAQGNDALSKLASNSTTTSNFTVTGGRNYTTAGNFSNSGTLVAGSGSTFDVNGNLTNFSGTTLTGGTYNVTGTLQFNGANIVTNAASITLTGASSQIIDQSSNNGLANFATNATGGKFTVTGGRNFTTAGNFTNNGSLTVGAANSKFVVNGNLTNFSGTTLTSGTYGVTGTLQFNGANIVTNSANLTMTGASAKISDQSSNNGLANFATNTGTFTAGSGFTFTSVGSFTNSGTFTVSSGAKFTIGGSGGLTQTAGTATDDGTLAVGTGFSLNGGSLFGKGTLTGNVNSSGTLTPGDSSTKTGILTETGAYTQKSAGTLDISIGGTTAGTKFDQLNVSSTASLNGTLNISLISGFVPTIGSTFKVVNYGSNPGNSNFLTINGLSINSTEHFTETVQGTDILLTVVSGPLRTTSGRLGLRPIWMAGNRVGGLIDLRLPMALRGMNGSRFLPPIAVRFVPRANVPVAMASTVRAPLSVSGVHVPYSLAMSGRAGTLALPAAPVAKSTLMTAASSFSQPLSFRAAASGMGVHATSGITGSRTAFSSSTLHASSFATLPGHRLYSGATATPHALSAFGNSNFRSSGMNSLARGLGSRAVIGGFAVPLSNHMSKPKLGFAVE